MEVIKGVAPEARSVAGTKRQLFRVSDMSGVGCTPEVTGRRPKYRFGPEAGESGVTTSTLFGRAFPTDGLLV